MVWGHVSITIKACWDFGWQEFFGDFVALDGHHFEIPVERPSCLLQPFSWDFASSSDAVGRMTEGLAAVALSLRRRFVIRSAFMHAVVYPELLLRSIICSLGDLRVCDLFRRHPFVSRAHQPSRSHLHGRCSCRYQRGSDVCEKLAKSLEHLTGSEERELFDFGRRSGDSAPLMLLLDR